MSQSLESEPSEDSASNPYAPPTSHSSETVSSDVGPPSADTFVAAFFCFLIGGASFFVTTATIAFLGFSTIGRLAPSTMPIIIVAALAIGVITGIAFSLVVYREFKSVSPAKPTVTDSVNLYLREIQPTQEAPHSVEGS